MAKENGMDDQIEGHIAVQKTEEDWSAVIQGEPLLPTTSLSNLISMYNDTLSATLDAYDPLKISTITIRTDYQRFNDELSTMNSQ